MEDIIQSLMDHHKIPGISLAVVKDGAVVHARGFGRRRWNSPPADADLVDAHTRFCIGSLTKAFTSTLWASILQEKRGYN